MLQPLTPLSADPFDAPWPVVDEGEVACFGLSIHAAAAWWDAAFTRAVPAERAHAGRFHKRDDALRHLAGRAALRALLAAQPGGQRAAGAEFTADRWGKPQPAGGGFQFSISHSGAEVWLALARSMPVGIDVERERPDTDWRGLSDALHPREAAMIAACPPGEGRGAFFRCWARKEAVAKAVGQGLSVPLQSFLVDVAGPADAWLLAPPPSAAGQGWATRDLPVPAGHAGALAVMGQPGRFSFHRLIAPV